MSNSPRHPAERGPDDELGGRPHPRVERSETAVTSGNAAILLVTVSLLLGFVGVSIGLSRAQDEEITAPQSLEEGAEKVETGLADQPLRRPLEGPSLAAPPAVVDTKFETPVPVSPNGPATIVRTIVQADGDLWFGSFQGLFRYDGKLFTSVTIEAGLAPTRVFALLRDREDRLWVGTMGAGVYRYDGTTWTRLTHEDGLAGDRVLALMQDTEGAIWIGHDGAGATRYDGRTFT